MVSLSCPQGVWWHGTLSGGAPRASPTGAGVAGQVPPTDREHSPRLPRAPGWRAPCRPSASCARASSTGRGGGGRSARPHHPARRVSRVHRGRGRACALEGRAGWDATGPAGTREAESRGRNGAEQRRAGDHQQPPLVPRFGHWWRLTPGVRPTKYQDSECQVLRVFALYYLLPSVHMRRRYFPLNEIA